mmetsp:Transcript_5074/g.7133  ORF Transcript_5074/g.7133 Transcript_5074/m.7133 type:complete len:97 (-) Transcript_5074:407-697(-)
MRNLSLVLPVCFCFTNTFTLGYHDQLRTKRGDRKRRKHQLYVVTSSTDEEVNNFNDEDLSSETELLSFEEDRFWNRALLGSHSMMPSSISMSPSSL